MELKTLWLGLVVSMAVFAVKTGFGWACLWTEWPRGRRVAVSFCILAGYAAMFSLTFLLASYFDLSAHYETLLPLWENGVVLHWITALVLCVWGVTLLKGPACSSGCGFVSCRIGPAFAMIIPCPVCISVVLMSIAGLVLYFPEEALPAAVALFAVFVCIAVSGGLLLVAYRKSSGEPPENTLGLLMLMTALYFMLSALLMPHVGEIERIYRLSANAHEVRQEDMLPVLCAWAGIFVMLCLGFVLARRHVRKAKSVSRVCTSSLL